MAIEKDFFRQVMGHFATGVTIVTTEHEGTLAGLTVNAFCSVSLHPPLVLVCVDLTSNTLPLIRESGRYAVNILTAEQEELSRCFATSSQERYEFFCNADYHVAATGAPILDGALAFVDTHVVAEYPGGDHVIFLGQVDAIGMAGRVLYANDADRAHATLIEQDLPALGYEEEEKPLAYYRGAYRHIAPVYRKPSLSTTTTHHENT